MGNGVRCMNEALIKQHIKQYKEAVLHQVQQSTLLKYTGAPVIDEERLFLHFYHFLMEKNGKNPKESLLLQ